MYSIPDFAGASGSNLKSSGEFDFSSLGGGGSNMGQNQHMNFPTMAATGGPLDMPTSGGNAGAPGTVPGTPPYTPPGSTGVFDPAAAGVGARLPGQMYQGRTIDPSFTSALDQWLRSQMGKGATPFDLSAILPSTGDVTKPGTLTAPENPILKSLMEFYTKGTGGPMAGVLPMWTSAMKSMEIPIQKQLANIKEQFGARGALGSSEMAQAMETYGAQTAADQEALLGQMTLQALPGMEQAGMDAQAIDQGAIDRLLQEFTRTRPEYSPLLGEEFGFGTLFPPMYSNKKGAFGEAFMGSLGTALGSGLGSTITPGVKPKGGG